MPKKNMGLGYALTRYHRIGCPTIRRASSAIGRSSARSATPTRRSRTLVGKMEAWWGRKYDRAALANLYGTLDARPLPATLMRGKAHEQAVAVAVLGDARRTEALPGIARQLANPFPLVRYYARRAVDALAPRPCPVDLDRPTPEIVAAVRACVPAAFPEPVPAELPGQQQRTRSDDSDED